jgi:hypothetical protein
MVDLGAARSFRTGDPSLSSGIATDCSLIHLFVEVKTLLLPQIEKTRQILGPMASTRWFFDFFLGAYHIF